MLDRERAIVLFTSERAVPEPSEVWDAVYDLRATVAARMVSVLAEQLRSRSIPAILLYPGWTRTEEQVESAKAGTYPLSKTVDELLEVTASPHYAGRAAAAVANDSEALALSGSLQTSHQLAERYAFTDVDGRCPDPT